MIEFKADCGHTLKVSEGDAGGFVQCMYCGRMAQIPQPSNDLSFLFRDIEIPPEPERKRRSWFFLRRKPGGRVDLFGLAFRLSYVAAIVVVAVVLSRKFLLPMFDPEARSRRLASGYVPAAPASAAVPTVSAVEPTGPGLQGIREKKGLYVASLPPGASVYVVEDAKAPHSGRFSAIPGAVRLQAGSEPVELPDGSYSVELAFSWTDPRLNDPSLAGYEPYVHFRREVESASPMGRMRLLNEFFVPDEAAGTFIEASADQYYIVRQYRGVPVRDGRSPGVRALFLPRLAGREAGFFSIEPLLYGYMPSVRAYGFDEMLVRRELDYHGVPAADQPFIVQALVRFGLISYVTPDRETRVFKIDIHDGTFAARLLQAARP